MDQSLTIETSRLYLHTVLPDEYLLLSQNLAHPDLWISRGFTDPIKYFANNPNPIKYRAPKIAINPKLAGYLLRVVVLKSEPIIIASAGFHDGPDQNGMIEIGFGVDKTYQGRGYGQEILHGMWSWVVENPEVQTLRYTVSPKNLVSLKIIKKLDFDLVGEQIDDEDGLELIYEMSKKTYISTFLGKSS
jgi:ribosomal-protein-alanine N-acetyltransferase